MRTKRVAPQRQLHIRPALLTAAWVLHKGPRAARCTIWSHPLGFELRLVCDGSLPRIRTCRTPEGMVQLQARWRAAMEAQGWSRKSQGTPAGILFPRARGKGSRARA